MSREFPVNRRSLDAERRRKSAPTEAAHSADGLTSGSPESEGLRAALERQPPRSVERCVTHHACTCHRWYVDRYFEAANALSAEPPATALDVERLADVLTEHFGPFYWPELHDVTILGDSPRAVAERIAAAYAADEQEPKA